MTPNQIIVDALQTKCTKLKAKAKKAEAAGRPEGHVKFLMDASAGIAKVINDINLGNITIVIH